MRTITKQSRKKLKRWYNEFCAKIGDQCHSAQILPNFENIDFYIDEKDKTKLAHTDEFICEICIAGVLLKAFGDKEDWIRFVMDHEFCHFIVLGHEERFRELMIKLGYRGAVWLWDYIGVNVFEERLKQLPINKERWCLK
jgi:hypothetical protein